MKAIYLRTSTEEQDPQNQLNDCLSLAGLTLQNSDKKIKDWEEHQEVCDILSNVNEGASKKRF